MKNKLLINNIVMSTIILPTLLLTLNAHAAVSLDDNLSNSNNMLCIGDTCPKFNSIPAIGTDGKDLNEDNEDPLESLLSEVEYINATIVGSSLRGKLLVTNSLTEEMTEVDPEDNEVEFLNKNGLITNDLAEAEMAYLPSDYFKGLRLQFAGKGKRKVRKGSVWNECTGTVKGGYLGKGCASRRFVNSSLLKMLGKLPRLVGAKSVYINHAGIAGDGRHSRRKSLHNTNRAIDIRALKVKGKNYVYRKAFTRNGSERRFYNRLISKWESSVRGICGGVVKATTIKWNDKHHRHHGHFGTTYNCR